MAEKYTAYIYGAGNLYNRLINQFQQCKDSLKILGIVTSLSNPYKEIDGYECFTVDNVDFGGVDFVIIAVEKWKEIFDILIKRGVNENQIIRGNVFELPDFDFREYIKLKRSEVSILANYCIGGMLYKKLGFKMTSPTIDMYCAGKGYLDFLEKYEYYLNCEMKELQCEDYVDGTLSPESCFLKGILGEKVVWHFNHSTNAEETITQWTKRKERFNFKNVAAIMIIQSDEDAFRFEELKIKKKLGVYYKDLGLEHVAYIPEWRNHSEIILKYGGRWPEFANEYMAGNLGGSPIHWIRFLLDSTSYYRKKLR